MTLLLFKLHTNEKWIANVANSTFVLSLYLSLRYLWIIYLNTKLLLAGYYCMPYGRQCGSNFCCPLQFSFSLLVSFVRMIQWNKIRQIRIEKLKINMNTELTPQKSYILPWYDLIPIQTLLDIEYIVYVFANLLSKPKHDLSE